MNMKIGTRILAGYFVVLLVFGVVGTISFQSTNSLVASAASVAHSHMVKEASTAVRVNLLNAETGLRGYIITGEDRYLDPYRNALRNLDTNVGRLRQLTGDNQDQQRRIDQLQQLIGSKTAELAESINLREPKGFQAAAAVVLTDRGRTVMDEIRRTLNEIDNEENSLLRQRDDETRQTAKFTSSSILLGGLIGAVLSAIIGVVVQRSITGSLDSFMGFAKAV